MAETLQFDLVSPERLLISAAVESVVVPGSEGYFTVLPLHAPLMSTLKPGVVEIRGASGDTTKIFVRGGFADVSPAGLTILADAAVGLEELDSARLEEEIRLAEEGLGSLGQDHPYRIPAEQKLNELRDMQRRILPA